MDRNSNLRLQNPDLNCVRGALHIPLKAAKATTSGQEAHTVYERRLFGPLYMYMSYIKSTFCRVVL